jgi:large subunit ribosomal protein L32e
MERELRLRRLIKRKKPEFLRTNWYRKKSLKNDPKWRWGHGRDTKLRLKMKGKPRVPETGYRSPRKVRGLLPNGKKGVIVRNVNDLEKIDKEREVAIIFHGVGKRKRQEILEKAKELGIEVWNAKVKAEA